MLRLEQILGMVTRRGRVSMRMLEMMVLRVKGQRKGKVQVKTTGLKSTELESKRQAYLCACPT